jgi:hypothetical protein
MMRIAEEVITKDVVKITECIMKAPEDMVRIDNLAAEQ